MALLLEVTFQDVNQLESKSSMWVESEEISADVLVALKAASNAKIVKASLSTPVPLVDIAGNTAVNDNVETASCKAVIAMRGPDADSTGEPFARARVGVPAPIGSLINGLSGDTSSSLVLNFMSDVLSKSGVQMTSVDSIKYAR